MAHGILHSEMLDRFHFQIHPILIGQVDLITSHLLEILIMMGGQISALEIQAMGPGISHSVAPLLFGLTILKTLIG